jgi:Transposase DDE domain
MTRPAQVLRWQQTLSTYLPHLSRPQVTVLALWSMGLILAHSCGLTTVATVLASLLARSEHTTREQLRDWYREAPAKNGAKRGRKRRTLDVTACFAPLLRWVVAWWDPPCPELALAMDASTLGQRFTILTISVVVRGCAIPVAWKVVEATRAGAWRPHWIALFEALDGSIPPNWTVIVLADRGLYARWLFTTIQTRGWHPYLRINRQGQYCPQGVSAFRPLSQVITRMGQSWAGAVTCFATKERQLSCTLLARWEAGYRDPWLVVTDLPPQGADVAWYGLRAWIECGFKDSKRGGWQWHQTKMSNPARAERLWLVIAVATLWTVSVGCAAEGALPVPVLADLPAQHVARRHASGRPRRREVSCFRRGRLVLIAALCGGHELPLGRLIPEPWPKSLDSVMQHPRARIPLRKAA